MSGEKPVRSIPEGNAAHTDAPPGDGMHLTTFGAGLLTAFGLAVLLPIVPLTVALLAGWGLVAGFRRLVRPGWASVPLLGWRLPYSPFDGLLWMVIMGNLSLFALVVSGVVP